MRAVAISALVFLCVLLMLPVTAQTGLEPFREIVTEYYADPYQVNISTLPSLSSLPIDDPDDGINWTKVNLPKPCASGDGGKTFVMVSRGNSNNLLIYLEGGGACSDYITCKLTPSVTTLNATNCGYCNLAYFGIFDKANPLNPFRNWTIVYVPYSTGDVHSGNRVMKYYNYTTNLNENITVYHVGFVNTVVTMRWLATQGSYNKIALAGSSAGGYGTIANFYAARTIFNKSLIVINDAGPGLSSKIIPQFMYETTNATWGYYQNFPAPALQYVKNGELLYVVEYVFDAFNNDSLYCLYENQQDYVIGTQFLGYDASDFRDVLLDVTSEIKTRYPNNFCRYLPLGLSHTILASPEFYTLTTYGVPVYQWVADVLNYQVSDVVAMPGDLNGDGSVNFNDLVLTLNLILTGSYDVNADIDLNGLINFDDLVGVLNIILIG